MNDDVIRAAAHAPRGTIAPASVVEPPGELRVVPAVAGALLFALGVRRRGAAGTLSAAAGAGLLAHALGPVVRDLVVRRGAARRAIDVEYALTVERPVREMFAFCTNFENFPALIRGLEQVDDYHDGRSRWVLRLPDGSLVEWDAIVTKFVPNQVIAWESVPASPVESRGVVRFHAVDESRTDVTLALTYAPKRTTFAQAWRALLAPRPVGRVDHQLARATDVITRWDPTFEPLPPTPMTPDNNG